MAIKFSRNARDKMTTINNKLANLAIYGYFFYIWLFFLRPQGVGRTPHMKGVRMLIGNFELNPYTETDLGEAQAFLTPKRDHIKHRQYTYFYTFSLATLNETVSTRFHISNRPLPFHLHLHEISKFLDPET